MRGTDSQHEFDYGKEISFYLLGDGLLVTRSTIWVREPTLSLLGLVCRNVDILEPS